jgi:hypothetical protein
MKTGALVSWLSAFFLGSLLFAVASASSLTDAKVKSFVASWSQVAQLFDEHDYEDDEFIDDDEDDEIFSAVNMISDMLRAMEDDPVYARVDAIARQHGFSSIDEWGAVGDRVMRAAFAVSMGDFGLDAEERLEQAMREIDQNPHLTEEQKQEFLRSMREAAEMRAEVAAAPEADKAAVRPYLDEIFPDDDDDDDYDD